MIHYLIGTTRFHQEKCKVIYCSPLTVHRSALAWGEFDIKKEALDVVVVGYFTGDDPDIWEVCDYQDRYTRITTEIPFGEMPPCQP